MSELTEARGGLVLGYILSCLPLGLQFSVLTVQEFALGSPLLKEAPCDPGLASEVVFLDYVAPSTNLHVLVYFNSRVCARPCTTKLLVSSTSCQPHSRSAVACMQFARVSDKSLFVRLSHGEYETIAVLLRVRSLEDQNSSMCPSRRVFNLLYFADIPTDSVHNNRVACAACFAGLARYGNLYRRRSL